MAVNVDPPVNFIDLFREGARWVDSNGVLTPEARKYLEEDYNFKYQVRDRTGGSDDAVASITSSETFETSSSSAEYHEYTDDNEQIEDLIYTPEPAEPELVEENAAREWEAILATASMTAVDHDMIEARNNATITLDSNASHNDQIIVGNGDGSKIIVDGGGVELRYKGKRANSLIFRREGTFIHWYKFVTSTEEYWRAS